MNVVRATQDRKITWDADVVISSALSGQLLIDADGNIVDATNMSVNGEQTSGTITPESEISVDDVVISPQIYFGAADIGSSSNDYGTWDFSGSTSEEVRITNRSPLDLVINNIAAGVQPQVVLDAPNVALQFDIAWPGVTPGDAATEVDIQNLGSGDIHLNGTIENPLGTTSILNTGGNILSAGSRDVVSNGRKSLVRTNILDIEATEGNVGDSTKRVNVDLVHSPGRPIQLVDKAGQSIYLDLKGYLRDSDVSDFTVNVDEIAAGGVVDLLLQGSVSEIGLGTRSPVRVNTPYENPTSALYINHFRPDDDSEPGPGGSTGQQLAIDSTYDFRNLDTDGNRIEPGLLAGGDIIVQAADPAAADGIINVVGITDLLAPATSMWCPMATSN